MIALFDPRKRGAICGTTTGIAAVTGSFFSAFKTIAGHLFARVQSAMRPFRCLMITPLLPGSSYVFMTGSHGFGHIAEFGFFD
jgi:hypothetical protein